MNRVAVVVPTLDPQTANRCCESLRFLATAKNCPILVAFNGLDCLRSDIKQSRWLNFIGGSDSDRIQAALEKRSGGANGLLFGSRRYGRSYGGAANLLLAVGIGLGYETLLKVDDDCVLEEPEVAAAWLETALSAASPRSVVTGFYEEIGRRPVDRLARTTAEGLVNFVYPEAQREARLSSTDTGYSDVLKNGLVLIPRGAAVAACYPVLRDPISGVLLRGEIYHWRYELDLRGFSVSAKPEWTIRHKPRYPKSTQSWLASLVVGFDTSFCFSAMFRNEPWPSSREREERIWKFSVWISDVSWPRDVNSGELVRLLERTGLLVADRFRSVMKDRQFAWKNVMSSGIQSAIVSAVPVLSRLVV